MGNCFSDAPLRSTETFPSGKRSEVSEGLILLSKGRILFSGNLIETFVPLFLMAGLLTRLAVIPAIVSFTIATKVTIGKDLTSPALPYLFGLIAIFIVGSGLYSVDYWLLYALAGN